MVFKKAILLTLSCLMLAITSHFIITPQEVLSAPVEIDIANFNPGRIIDDSIFTNSSTMTAAEIQRFLEVSVNGGECDRYKENLYGDTYTSPYTCLFELQQNIETGEHNYGLFEEDGSPTEIEGGLTAAEIIWQAAQDHQINPQVLLVLLQKEQSLITDNWPWLLQYEKATGYNCPDTAPCSPTTASFYKQIVGAAWQFRQYLDYIDEYWYVVGTNRILYNPNTACGHQVVDIENKATIALYLYTPYVPNQAALNNFFGYGDACSAYGNRNFWAYFNRWFGPATSDSAFEDVVETEEEGSKEWSFEPFFQGVFTDPSKQVALDSVNNRLGPNQSAYVVFDFRNTGTETWTREAGENQVILIPSRPEGRLSQICHSTWQDSCQQVALMNQAEVKTNEVGTFEFEILTPTTNGNLIEHFSLKNQLGLLEEESVQIIFDIIGGDSPQNTNNESSPSTTDNQEDSNTVEETGSSPPTTETTTETVAVNTVVLPDDWRSLNVIEKILLNPWGCHDTTQIRADNGQCLSGGYTIPNAAPIQVADQSPSPPPTTETTTETVAVNTVVLPDDWRSLNVIEKILLNPWGCHDTTQIRADNGQCLSGGYTIPNAAPIQVADQSPSPPPTTETTTETVAVNTVVLPDDWRSLNVIEKILLNPWGCHDTTQIRADNGQCLSGGYTIPNAAPIQVADQSPSPPPTTETTTETVAVNTVVLPDDWRSLNVIEKILLNPWGCHDTTQIRADNGQCLSGGYTIPNAA